MTASEKRLSAESQELGAPFFFATGQAPTASAIDDDIYLTVTAAVPEFPGGVETIDIILSVDYAKAVIAQLSTAVIVARSKETSAELEARTSVFLRRGRECHPEAGTIVGGRAVEPVQLGDRGDEREPKPGSRRFARLGRRDRSAGRSRSARRSRLPVRHRRPTGRYRPPFSNP